MNYKIFALLLCSTCFLAGCKSLDDAPIDPNNPNESENPSENPPISSISVSVKNAFPNLSFTKPLDFQSPNDGTDRIFVVEQGGIIRVFPNNESQSEHSLFLNISNQLVNRDELGLLGLAFHPNYSSNGFFYLMYTPTDELAVISRFQVSSDNANVASNDSELVLLEIPQPFANHNGGQLAFGPDGFLYIASGDGGSAGDPQGNSQNLSNLLGKILRIDVDNTANGLNYDIPSDNPFITNNNARSEIYAYGLRNPWRFSFDVNTDLLWLADVGQNELEEIDIIENGGNYGWNTKEGTRCFISATCDNIGLIDPIFEYEPINNDRSITGGYVYYGDSTPSLKSLYVYGDFISGRVWALTTNLNENLSNQLLVDLGFNISSFGTDNFNELYICGFDGNIYKLIEN